MAQVRRGGDEQVCDGAAAAAVAWRRTLHGDGSEARVFVTFL